jgi:hypothetical protein
LKKADVRKKRRKKKGVILPMVDTLHCRSGSIHYKKEPWWRQCYTDTVVMTFGMAASFVGAPQKSNFSIRNRAFQGENMAKNC